MKQDVDMRPIVQSPLGSTSIDEALKIANGEATLTKWRPSIQCNSNEIAKVN